jgi:hypothetical protein
MEIGSMQVFSQGQLRCHLHTSPVSPSNQITFVQLVGVELNYSYTLKILTEARIGL